MAEEQYTVYVRTDGEGRILDIGSDAFLRSVDGWTTMPAYYKYLSDLVTNKDDGTGRPVSSVYTNDADEQTKDASADAITAARDSVLSPMSGIASIVKKVSDFFG